MCQHGFIFMFHGISLVNPDPPKEGLRWYKLLVNLAIGLPLSQVNLISAKSNKLTHGGKLITMSRILMLLHLITKIFQILKFKTCFRFKLSFLRFTVVTKPKLTKMIVFKQVSQPLLLSTIFWQRLTLMVEWMLLKKNINYLFQQCT